jgi:phosphomethylpyrimidine synthase
VKIAEDAVPHCGTAEQGIAEEEALKKGLEEKSRQFVEKGAEI